MNALHGTATVTVSSRYIDLTDHALAAALSTEDESEERGLDPFRTYDVLCPSTVAAPVCLLAHARRPGQWPPLVPSL